MKSDRFTILLHIAIAIMLLPVYQTFGESFKYIVAPYVLYLVWKRDPAFLPALIIHFSLGSTISYLILLTTLILTITNLHTFRKMRLNWLIFLAFLPFPIFLYQTGVRIFEMNLGLIDTIIPLGFYLGIFPFFYGILLFPKFNETTWKALIAILLVLPFLKFMPGVATNIRAYWFSFPLSFTICWAILLYRKLFNFNSAISMAAILFLIITAGLRILGLKFTLIFSGFVALTSLILSVRKLTFFLKFVTRPKVIIISSLLVAGIIAGINKYGNIGSVDTQNLSYFNWDDFWLLFQYKAFDDRAVIWAGGWELVKGKDMLWPPYSPPSYSFYNARGSIISDVEFGIHNIGLELMRNYGLVVGTIITIIYSMMLIKGPGKLLLNKQCYRHKKFLILFSATCLGVGLVGGLVGQHVLMPTFSLILMGISGVLYGYVIYNNPLTKKHDRS